MSIRHLNICRYILFDSFFDINYPVPEPRDYKSQLAFSVTYLSFNPLLIAL